LPERTPDGSPWPLVSVVTPSFRQAAFLEETLRSVLLQGYPNLEYLVVDGGSQDGSVAIIRAYERWLAHWVSEPDRGQSHAINKGMARARGQFVLWVNSDDLLLPGALGRAVAALQAQPAAGMLYSDGLWIDERSATLRLQVSGPLDLRGLLMEREFGVPQPTAVMRCAAWEAAGGLNERLHMAMDFDLWVRIALRFPIIYLPGAPLAGLRFHASQKTQTRVGEDRAATMTVIERALRDPACPPGLALAHSTNYAMCALDLAAELLRPGGDWRAGMRYLLRAVSLRPTAVIPEIALRQAVHTYRRLAPPSVQRGLRRLRGTSVEY
jgi:glycosyltransferase involved in cell wall biosynthesis